MKTKLISLLILGILILFIWLMMQDKGNRTYIYPDFGVPVPQNFRTLGIDVSHYQESIDWQLLKKMKTGTDSIGFVYIKLTEGIRLLDQQADENAKGATEVNLPFGFYHFFRPTVSATEQADFYSESCENYAFQLRPVLDIELSDGLSSQRLTDSVYVFLELVEKRLGFRPLIYTGDSFYKDNFKDSYLKHETYWIANYNGSCESIENENVLIWQFSDRGTVNGIKAKVDLNVAKPEFWNQVYLKDSMNTKD